MSRPKPLWIARVARHWPSYAAVLDGKVCAYCGGQAETFSRMPKQDPIWYCRELCRAQGLDLDLSKQPEPEDQSNKGQG